MSDGARAEAAFWAGFLRNRNVDAGTAGDGAVAVAGGYALCVTGTLLDYAIGAGSARAVRPDDLDVVEAFYAARRLPSRFELSAATLERDGALFRERGYGDDGLELAAFAGTLDVLPPEGLVSVRTTTDRRAWTDLLIRGLADQSIEAGLLRRTAALNAAAAHVLVIASLDGSDIGVGAAGIAGDAAVLYSGAVLPAFRGRGAQRAMFAARLYAAAGRGAARAFTKGVAGGATARCAARFGFTGLGTLRRLRRPPE
ncbi:hypothetical protein [Vulcanimicrobium alpinum]|uniref:hypothetical protein n=1 Tax=Vulcanimicrobium alpinum TaxID=3016050 RepID=UPI00295EE475|nr:hypothetical protein [Vulcanimicrobium alpinum]